MKLSLLEAIKDKKYLQGLNMKALQRGTTPGADPRTFYQQLLQQAVDGPIFSKETLNFLEQIPFPLQKHEAKWIANVIENDNFWAADPSIKNIEYVLSLFRKNNKHVANRHFDSAFSLAQKMERIEKATTAAQREKPKIIYQFDDGFYIAQVKNPALEGELMQHCLRGKCQSMLSGESIYLSLRDLSNKPHVTIEVDPSTNKIVEIRGKQNKAPVGKYAEKIKDWVENQTSFHISPDKLEFFLTPD